jgi:hypothetical protein
MRNRLPVLLIALAAFTALAAAEHQRIALWTTSDEPFHVAASRQLRSGDGLVSNFEHPVVMKVLAAAGLSKAPPESPIIETRHARRLFPVVFALLVAVAGTWATQRSGAAAGTAVAFLLALEPTMRGHASIVHTDVLVTFFLVAAAATLDLSASAPRLDRRLLILSGVLYGGAIASKYSALPFLAVFVVASAFRLRTMTRHMVREAMLRVALPALLTAGLVQALAFLGTSDAAFRAGLAAEFHGLPQESAVLGLADRLPKWAAAYGSGLLFVRGVAGPGERFNYFRGEVSGAGFPLYFPAALALKLTTASVVSLGAAFIALGLALFRVLRGDGARLARLAASRTFLPAALGGAYFLAAASSNVNIGVRHVLPAVPFLLVAAAGTARTLLWHRPRLLAGLLAGTVLLAGLEAGARLGHEISFGNLFAGGPSRVHLSLSDSNVDWGQEQGLLFDRVRSGGLGRVAVLTLFLDEVEARGVGIVGQLQGWPAPVDSVFVSRHLDDVGRAIERNTENYPKFVWLRGWLPPILSGLRASAVSVEPFGDCYLLFRLAAKPTNAANEARAAPAAPPAPSP